MGEVPVFLSRNELLATKEEWGPSYVVSFDFFANSWNEAGFHNLFTITEGAKKGAVGTKVPAIYTIFYKKHNQLQIWTDISDIQTGTARLAHSGPEKWYNMKIIQSFREVKCSLY